MDGHPSEWVPVQPVLQRNCCSELLVEPQNRCVSRRTRTKGPLRRPRRFVRRRSFADDAALCSVTSLRMNSFFARSVDCYSANCQARFAAVANA